jgi:hypothetical protein
MKTTLLAAALLVAGTPLYAGGFSFGGEVDSTYNVDSEKALVVLTPEVNYTMGDTNIELSSPINVVNTQSTTSSDFVMFDALEDGTYPLMNLEVTHQLRTNLELSAGSSYNLNTHKRGNILIGASFKF